MKINGKRSLKKKILNSLLENLFLGKKKSPNIIRNGKENNENLEMEIKTKERLYTNSAYKLINFNWIDGFL